MLNSTEGSKYDSIFKRLILDLGTFHVTCHVIPVTEPVSASGSDKPLLNIKVYSRYRYLLSIPGTYLFSGNIINSYMSIAIESNFTIYGKHNAALLLSNRLYLII